MTEIPKEAIEVSFAAVGAALHCVNAIPGTPFANDIEAAVEAAAPFLRKQFEAEQLRPDAEAVAAAIFRYMHDPIFHAAVELVRAREAEDLLFGVIESERLFRKQFEDEHPVAEEDGHTFTADEWARWATDVAVVASTARGARQVIERAVDAGASPGRAA